MEAQLFAYAQLRNLLVLRSGDLLEPLGLTMMQERELPERLGSTTSFVSSSGKELVYSSRVSTLVDSVYDWSRFGSLPRGYEWIRQDISAGRCNTMELAECSVAFEDVGTQRRIGYLMEKVGYENEGVELPRNALTATSSTIPWIPGRPKRGSTHRQWGIVDNSE